MRKSALVSIALLICICLMPGTGHSCTAFSLSDGERLYAGKNFDFKTGDGLICINKRGLSKTSFTSPAVQGTPAQWQSKYGSVTFNFFGCEFPNGGINEAGLVVETLLELAGKTMMPQPDGRPYVLGLEWLQYQLDTAATVDEVIASDSIIRVPRRANEKSAGGHFFISDRQGNSACLEWIDGTLVVYTGDTLSVTAVTNTLYEDSLRFLSLFQGFGGILPIPRSNFWMHFVRTNSLVRFVRAADMLRKYDNKTTASARGYSFDVLKAAAESITIWSIVYDIGNLKVDFITDNNTAIRSFDIGSFDFSCKKPALLLDINANLSGDVSGNFQEYTTEINREFVEKGQRAFNTGMTDEEIDRNAKHPESFVCVE